MTLGVSGLDKLPVPILVAHKVAQYLKPLIMSRACIDKFDRCRKRLSILRSLDDLTYPRHRHR
jgi:hypothetical protein